MTAQPPDYETLVETAFPGLVGKIRRIIQESETRYEGSDGNAESFLWEHTLHTAAMAYRLSREEGMDPLLPVIAAFFHDAGKFSGGEYHPDEEAEEEESARIARGILQESGMAPTGIDQVVSGLKALYREDVDRTPISAVVHDADFLSKFGALGIASFFTKSALRGRTLQSSVLGYLSKELTYASTLPLTMHTAAGRKLATKKSNDSIRFFRALLAELRETQIADLRLSRVEIPDPARPERQFSVQLVASPSCAQCGRRWKPSWTIEKGVKCRKLNVEWNCQQCHERVETSFCLPELA